jgi:hypothetical protein
LIANKFSSASSGPLQKRQFPLRYVHRGAIDGDFPNRYFAGAAILLASILLTGIDQA